MTDPGIGAAFARIVKGANLIINCVGFAREIDFGLGILPAEHVGQGSGVLCCGFDASRASTNRCMFLTKSSNNLSDERMCRS